MTWISYGSCKHSPYRAARAAKNKVWSSLPDVCTRLVMTTFEFKALGRLWPVMIWSVLCPASNFPWQKKLTRIYKCISAKTHLHCKASSDRQIKPNPTCMDVYIQCIGYHWWNQRINKKDNIRDGFMRKNWCSFGFCPNYLWHHRQLKPVFGGVLSSSEAASPGWWPVVRVGHWMGGGSFVLSKSESQLLFFCFVNCFNTS